MNGQEAVNTLKFRLNRGTSASSAFEAELLTELQNAQNRLEISPELPHFLLTERAFISLTQGEERVAVPTSFLREKEESDMQVEDTEESSGSQARFTELRKMNMDQLRRRWPDEPEGRPEGYALQGNYFRLRPIPDKTTYRLWMPYYKKDDAIALGATNLWLGTYPELVIAEAGVVLAAVLKNPSAAQFFASSLTQERDRFVRNETARREENFDPNPED